MDTFEVPTGTIVGVNVGEYYCWGCGLWQRADLLLEATDKFGTIPEDTSGKMRRKFLFADDKNHCGCSDGIWLDSNSHNCYLVDLEVRDPANKEFES